ncbi:thiamine diphosphokinase [Alteribacter populi]|uniref:thiamine diphosphokinase n=1 Tax=Alteribacter populi TaxID=2011011 RepID=UPI000BBA9E1A|nr:thiamine diphosphokinase [Alteribacter populi]
MDYIILAGGPRSLLPSLEKIKQEHPDALWIGVDRGVYDLVQHHIIPHQAFGDFDSLTETELDWINEQSISLSVYPEEKDETDMELALNWVLNQDPRHIYLYGATGGRLDHLFANVQLLLKGIKQKVPITMVDCFNRVQLREPGSYTVTGSPLSYYSFIPFTPKVEEITIEGFKYELHNDTLWQGTSLSVSNRLVQKSGKVSFTTGLLLFFESMDQ